VRVAMVSEHASPLATIGQVDAGGQNVHVAALSAALTRLGHEVTVFTRRDNARLPREVLAPEGYRVVHVDAGPAAAVPKDELLPYMQEFGRVLAAAWKAEHFDVAHAHFWMSGVAATRAGADAKVPVLQTFHALGTVKRRYQGSLDTSPPRRIAIETRLAHSVSHVIATCSDESLELTAMGTPASHISVIPCGVDLDAFFPGSRPVRSHRRPMRLLTVGRLVERKGVDDAVRALASLPNTELRVAGGPARQQLDDDPEVQRLRRVALRAGVADRVVFLGRVSRAAMPTVIRSADVVVATPWYEPFGIVPLEAMACGRPIVASAVGGILDSVVDGVTGLLVPPKDPRILGQRLRELLDDPQRRADMGVAGAMRSRLLYGWDRIAASTARVYQAVTEGGHVPIEMARQRGVLAEERVQ
jgi:D-inositol-3-phosphate glycosyltransferase